MERPSSSRIALIAALLGVVCIGCGRREPVVGTALVSNDALVFWRSGERSGSVRVLVVDGQGRPLAGRRVYVGNSSGGQSVTTDERSVAELAMGEPEIASLSVDERELLRREGALREGPLLWRVGSEDAAGPLDAFRGLDLKIVLLGREDAPEAR